jgi:hypothetical protein
VQWSDFVADSISADVATATAIAQAESTIPVRVLSTKLSTYGAEAGGGSIVDASTPVWAVQQEDFHPRVIPSPLGPHPELALRGGDRDKLHAA